MTAAAINVLISLLGLGLTVIALYLFVSWRDRHRDQDSQFWPTQPHDREGREP